MLFRFCSCGVVYQGSSLPNGSILSKGKLKCYLRVGSEMLGRGSSTAARGCSYFSADPHLTPKTHAPVPAHRDAHLIIRPSLCSRLMCASKVIFFPSLLLLVPKCLSTSPRCRSLNVVFNLKESSKMHASSLFTFRGSSVYSSEPTLFLRFVYLSMNLFIAVTARQRKLLSGEYGLPLDPLYVISNVCVCVSAPWCVSCSCCFMSHRHSSADAYMTQPVAAALAL